MEQTDLKNTFQHIFDICRDGAEGYKKAAKVIVYQDLKVLFIRIYHQRKLFIEELKSGAIKSNIKLETDRLVRGYFYSTWLMVGAKLSSVENEKLLEQSLNGEQVAVDIYSKVLANPTLPRYLRETLAEQQHYIKIVMKQLNALQPEVY